MNKLNSFNNYTITKILTFINNHYTFFRQLNILDYFNKTLKKNKYFYNNIKNII